VKVLVYVEGPADRVSLAALLKPIIDAGRAKGIGISFHELRNKDGVLRHGPNRAAAYLKEQPDGWVIALPDLYPMKDFTGTPRHSSFSELRAGMRKAFEKAAQRHDLPNDVRSHFLVHCLKHDLEVLLLAAPDQLRARLGTTEKLADAWRKPVEDQDDIDPPKRVVERLFKKYRGKGRYTDTVDAPRILERASLVAVEAACPCCFAPFVDDLRAIIDGRTPPTRQDRPRKRKAG
jgi:hypothetical protein